MFDSIGWGEILVLALAALFIFGPERLPDLAKDAAAGLKKLRGTLTGVRAQVDESLGEDLAGLRDLDLRKYHPKTFIREQLFSDDDDGPPVRRGTANGNGSGGLARETAGATAAGAGPIPGRRALAARSAAARPRDAGTPPPFDVDAT